jgi:hypothetical protein
MYGQKQVELLANYDLAGGLTGSFPGETMARQGGAMSWL